MELYFSRNKYGDVKKRRPYKTRYSKGFCRFNKPIEPLKITENLKLMKKLYFILRTNFATRRTLVRLRASKIKPEALILLSLSVLHLFFYPLKGSCKKTCVFCSSFCLFTYRFHIAEADDVIFCTQPLLYGIVG